MVSCTPIAPGLLTSILDQASDALLVLNREWCLLYANERAAQLLGQPVAALLGRELWTVCATLAGSLMAERCQAALAAGVPATVTIQRLGGEGWLQVCLDPSEQGVLLTLREQGKPRGESVGPRMDEAQLRETVEHAAAGIAHVGLDGRWLWVNQRLCEITGYSRAALLARSFQEITHPDDLEADLHHARELLDGTRQTYSVEKRYLRADGSPIWIDLTVSLVRTAAGEPEYFISVVNEIEDRKRVEAALQHAYAAEHEARARAEATLERLHAIESVTDTALARLSLDDLLGVLLDRIRTALGADTSTVLLLSDEGDALHVQAAAGIDQAEWRGIQVPLGQGVAGRIAQTGQPQIINDLWQVDVVSPVLQGRLRSLVAVPLLVEGALIGVLHAGSFTLHRFSGDDLTLLQRVADRVALTIAYTRRYREAQAAIAARDALLSSVSHDLRNPLVSIKGLAQLSRRQLAREVREEGDRVLKNLDGIEAASERMTAMLSELLDAARLVNGHGLELDRQPVDLVELAQAAITAYAPSAPGHRLELVVDEPELCGVWDAARLERVLANLLTNAVKFSPAGSPITIALACDEVNGHDWAVLRVTDEGIGIPAADLPLIGVEFHRAGNVVGRIEGTGIGLASARRIVEAHGGSLAIESVEGEGTTVTVRLPLA